MPKANLLRTTAFRLTILYLGLFVASVLAILALVYWLTVPYVEAQADATIDAEIQGLGEQYRQRGLSGLIEVVARRSRLPGSNIYLVVQPNGSPVVGNLSAWPGSQPDRDGWLQFEIAERSGEGRQDARARAFALPGGYRLLVGQELSSRRSYRGQMQTALTWAALLTIGLGALGGALISRRILQRVEGMNRAIRTIMDAAESGEGLIGRVPLRGTGDEFDQLAETVNAMLNEIELLLSSMRHMTEGVAHDLRTPLSRLRSRIELALRQAEDAEGYRSALEEAMVEADRLLGLFNALLSIAAAESTARRENFTPLRLAPLVRDVVELYEPVAEERRCRLSLRIENDVEIVGYGQLLSQAVSNLVDNAVKYTGEGGAVTVTVHDTNGDDGPAVTVADTGPGIPPEHRDAVLRPFIRLETSRNSPGNGLGLSLVAAVARLHRARLLLSDNQPGLRISLVFPRGS